MFCNLFKIDISVFVFLILSMLNKLEIFSNFTRLVIYNFSNFIIELLYVSMLNLGAICNFTFCLPCSLL